MYNASKRGVKRERGKDNVAMGSRHHYDQNSRNLFVFFDHNVNNAATCIYIHAWNVARRSLAFLATAVCGVLTVLYRKILQFGDIRRNVSFLFKSKI